jgi:hypothetical protein
VGEEGRSTSVTNGERGRKEGSSRKWKDGKGSNHRCFGAHEANGSRCSPASLRRSSLPTEKRDICHVRHGNKVPNIKKGGPVDGRREQCTCVVGRSVVIKITPATGEKESHGSNACQGCSRRARSMGIDGRRRGTAGREARGRESPARD